MSEITFPIIVYKYPIRMTYLKFVLTYKRNPSHLYWKVQWKHEKYRALEHVNSGSNLNPATD